LFVDKLGGGSGDVGGGNCLGKLHCKSFIDGSQSGASARDGKNWVQGLSLSNGKKRNEEEEELHCRMRYM
jgi:hypothetical protein